MHGSDIPLFRQLATQISNDIVAGTFAEGDLIPSTNEYAAFWKMNPATANKGVNILVDEGILTKRRGIGMVVAEGALATLQNRHRTVFREEHVRSLVAEARRLGLTETEVTGLIHEEFRTAPHEGDLA